MKQNLTAKVLNKEFIWTLELESTNPLAAKAAATGLETWLKDAANRPDFTETELADPAMLGQDPAEGVSAEAHRKSPEYKKYLAFTKKIKIRTVKARLQEIVTGEFTGEKETKRGQTPEQKAWVWFLNKLGKKEGGDNIGARNLSRALDTYVRAKLLQEFDAGTPERAKVEANLGQHVTERRAEIISAAQSTVKPLSMRIESENIARMSESILANTFKE